MIGCRSKPPLAVPGRSRRQLLPGLRGETLILGKALFPKHLRVKPCGSVKNVELAFDLKLEKLAGELDGLRAGRNRCSKVDFLATVEQAPTMTVRIIDARKRVLDPLQRPRRQFQRQGAASRRTMLAGYFAPGTDFRKPLIASLRAR